jgi:hypothetical protein
MRTMNFEKFNTVHFPPAKGSLPGPGDGFIYVFFWVADGVENPFYVGQTQRLSGRMDDYLSASFQASTDFRVGEAVKYLHDVKKYPVVVKYRASTDPPKEEYEIIRDLLMEGTWLLNCFPGYDYLKANEAEERNAVQRFCYALTGSRTKAAPGS